MVCDIFNIPPKPILSLLCPNVICTLSLSLSLQLLRSLSPLRDLSLPLHSPLSLRFHRCVASDLHRKPLFSLPDLRSSSTVESLMSWPPSTVCIASDLHYLEVQGVLTVAQKHWPHIHIFDLLVMADSAVKMVKAGCQYITVLGVDFMSENVRAILDQAGFLEDFTFFRNVLSLGLLHEEQLTKSIHTISWCGIHFNDYIMDILFNSIGTQFVYISSVPNFLLTVELMSAFLRYGLVL